MAAMMEQYSRKISFTADDAGCDRGGVPVVRGASFGLAPGEAIQLFGSNGSGKTSLLGLLAGHIHAAEGQVRWRDGDGSEQDAPFTDSIFFLGHEASVKPALTAEENLFFWARLYGVDDTAKNIINDALEQLGVADLHDVRAGRLSAGQRRRVDFARALIAQREVWLMDEPSAALDRDGAAIVGDVIAQHLGRGGIAVIATHDDLDVASRRLELRR